VIRAFVAVRIESVMIQKISEVQSQLQESLTGIRWVAEENLHFTLKFLGSVEDKKVASIMQALEEALRPVQCFSLVGKGIGVFPKLKRARVLWIGLQGQGLHRIAAEVETALEPLGFSRERRDFAPHLTLGRWRNPGLQPQRLREQIERWQDYDFGQSKVDEVVLFQSVLKPNGAVYSPLGVIRLSEQQTQ
jgi:2'-5' RNA ligase